MQVSAVYLYLKPSYDFSLSCQSLRKKRQCLQLSFNVYFKLNFCQMLSSEIFLLKIDADFNTFIYLFSFYLQLT